MIVREAKMRYRKVDEISVDAVDTPGRVHAYLESGYEEYPDQETFWVIGLDRKNKPKFRMMTSLGTANSALTHPREVFKPAILASCSGVIVGHNHPSGNPEPSSADIKITRQLKEAGEIIGIPLLDHVISGNKIDDPSGQGFYSFQESGLV